MLGLLIRPNQTLVMGRETSESDPKLRLAGPTADA
jgi:hypothetical protein